MVRYFASLFLLGSALHANPPQWAQFLPSTANITAIEADAQGNIYVAGSIPPSAPKGVNDATDAFLAKYSSAGDQVFFHPFGGSNTDGVNALAIGDDGAIYAAGNTSSTDFPTTIAAQLPPAPGSGGPFLAKFDPTGATTFSVVYGLDTSFSALAVDDQGQAVITGRRSSGGTPGFVAKLSQDGTRVLFTFVNYGGTAVALDAEANIYVAGFTDEYDPTITQGAFQATHASRACAYTAMLGFPCFYQHVAKISADGTKLVYATFLDGTYGATPSALVVDSTGDAIVAGTTYSSDYPITPGVLQNVSTALGTQTLYPNVAFPVTPAPPSSGFITKLNAAGGGLIWSTLFSGTREDNVTAMTVAPDSTIYIAGLAGSADLPGLQSTPAGCRPKFLQFAPFVAHLTSDASAIYGAALFGDALPAPFEKPLIAVTAGGLVAAATSGPPAAAELASVDLDTSNALACVTDAADAAPIASVAPGQLVTLYGDGFASYTGNPSPAPGFPTQDASVTVSFNELRAPLLYVSPGQINAQVPFEVAGSDIVTMTLSAQPTGEPPVNETRLLRVVPSSPALFRSAETVPVCAPAYTHATGVVVPLARNADGTFNSSCNPAAFGSTVTVYVNGAGELGVGEKTGLIAPRPGSAVSLGFANGAVAILPEAAVTAAATMPGSIFGLVQLQVELPDYTSDGFFQINLQQGAVPFRDQGAVIWVK